MTGREQGGFPGPFRWHIVPMILVLFGSASAAPRHHRGASPHADPHASRHSAQAEAARARAALLAARSRGVRDLAAQRIAAARASQDVARAIALSAQAREAATRLRETETRAADTAARIEALDVRRQALEVDLAHEAALLAPMLPLIERLSLYPAETLLAVSGQPADALSGLMLLHGLGTQLEIHAEAIRARQLDLARLTTSLETQNRGLAVLRQEQAARGERVTSQAELAAAAQRASQDAADTASRQAAASASRAATLQDAVSRIEAAQRAAEAEFQREAAAADHARKPEIARTARGDAAAVASDAGPGLAPAATGRAGAAAPVAGRQVQGWGASTDAGPATGVTYAPPAMALVTSPCSGRIDFAGPFRSYGQMLILDCGHGYRFVLAGLDRLDVAVGQKLAKGVAVGRMPDWSLAGSGGRPSLYVQLRHGSQAIDPSDFLHSPS